MKPSVLLLSLLLLTPIVVRADCSCVCMQGQVRAVCSGALDLKPICAPRICPVTPPSVKPIQKPRVPPIGTTKCVQRQIYNEQSERYQWREVCY